MIIIIYLFIVVFITGILVDVLPFLKIIKNVSVLGKKSASTIQATDIHDDEKQKILLSCSMGIFKESFKIAFFTLVILGFVYLAFLLGDYIETLSFDKLVEYSITLPGIIVSLVAFFAYFGVKKLYGKFRV